MKTSSGCLIILRGEKILLGHPSSNSWRNCFTPPKGGVDEGESLIDAAIRETKEEVSITIDPSQILNTSNPFIVDYSDKKGVIFKRVYLFEIRINSISEIGIENEIIDTSKLQIEEMDWAGFLTKEECKSKIFHRFWPVIDKIL